jgi:putative phosphoserine phosphatase/1-acylglycerol-3-phosphate O-acyltransferase
MLLPGLLWAFLVPFGVVVALLVAPRAGRQVRLAAMHLWGGGMKRLFGIRIEVMGREHLEAPGARLLFFNHQSILDLVLLTWLWPQDTVVLYKKEFHRIPFFGLAMKRMGLIPVDRRNRLAAITSLRDAARRIREEGNKVFVAPEGTRSRTDGLLPFKRGPFHLALQTRAPIVPVIFRGVRALLPQGKVIPRSGVLRVDVLPPIDTSDWDDRDLDRHVRELREVYLAYVPGATKLTGEKGAS